LSLGGRSIRRCSQRMLATPCAQLQRCGAPKTAEPLTRNRSPANGGTSVRPRSFREPSQRPDVLGGSSVLAQTRVVA
jgi:hypothetical protein